VPIDAALYPVNLVVAGRRCLVVGGGAVAAAKAAGLVRCGADVDVVAAVIGPEVRSLDVTCHERPYRAGDVAGYRLVVAATGDASLNREIYEEADAAGIWVNAADDPASCSFALPAVVRRGPITVAVGTGGRSPALASWLRARLDEHLGPEYEILVELMTDARAQVKAAGRSTEAIDWRKALDSDMLDLIRAGQVSRARERLRACLSSSSD